MDLEKEQSEIKQNKKKLAVSLTDEEYNDLFNSVINYSSNKEYVDCQLPHSFNQQDNDSDKENVDPQKNGKPKKSGGTKNVNKSKDCGAEKKLVPKFSAPLKGKSMKQHQPTKFIPPHLKTTIAGNATNDEKRKDNFSAPYSPEKIRKSQEFKNLNDIFKPAVKTSKNIQGILSVGNKIDKQNINQRDFNVSKNAINKNSTDKKESPLKNKTNEQKVERTKPPAKGGSREKAVKVSLEMSSSDESSSESSQSDQASQESRGRSSVSNMCLSQGRDGNMYMSLSGSSSMLLSQPPVELNQRQRMEWLRSRRDVGVWVQCCNAHCSKWRYLENVKDPIDVPEYWICEMNDDPKYNSCGKIEKGPTISEQVDLIDNKYTAGSVVWARLPGFPWWPAIVDDDPDVEAYYWLNGFSDIPTYYHVAFFDKEEVTRAWIRPENLKRFTEKDTIPRTLRQIRGTNFSPRIEIAKQIAIEALQEQLPARLHKFGFLARFKGPIGKKINTPDSKALSKLQSHMNKEKILSRAKEQEKKSIEKRKSTTTEKEKVKKRLKRKENRNSKTDKKQKTKESHFAEKGHDCRDQLQANYAKPLPIRSNEADNEELNTEKKEKSHSPGNLSDIDPFLEDAQEGGENTETIQQNTVGGSEFCSNMATVGTYCNEKRKNTSQFQQITKTAPEMSRAASHNITKQEADTSSNAHQISLDSNRTTFQKTSNNCADSRSQSKSNQDSSDAVVPDIPQMNEDDGNSSDPFEEDD